MWTSCIGFSVLGIVSCTWISIVSHFVFELFVASVLPPACSVANDSLDRQCVYFLLPVLDFCPSIILVIFSLLVLFVQLQIRLCDRASSGLVPHGLWQNLSCCLLVCCAAPCWAVCGAAELPWRGAAVGGLHLQTDSRSSYYAIFLSVMIHFVYPLPWPWPILLVSTSLPRTFVQFLCATDHRPLLTAASGRATQPCPVL